MSSSVQKALFRLASVAAQQPNWIGALSQSEQRAEIEEWIQLFCQRYPDVALIDVVNEPPPHTTPPYIDALGGAGTSGYDWDVRGITLWGYVRGATWLPNTGLMSSGGQQRPAMAWLIDFMRR